MFSINNSQYDKAKKYPIDHGYDERNGMPFSIVAHSTEGSIGQPFVSAADYLYTSAKVSAHYLIGRAGEIVQFLDTRRYSAWHSGVAEQPYTNQRSIGIECLHARGENWPSVQKDALAWLLNRLATQYTIPARLIDTHGQIAIPGPYQRKIDPTNWPRADFKLFVDQALAPIAKSYRVRRVMVSQRQEGGEPYAGELQPGEIVLVDKWYTNGYVHLASGLGFVKLADLEAV